MMDRPKADGPPRPRDHCICCGLDDQPIAYTATPDCQDCRLFVDVSICTACEEADAVIPAFIYCAECRPVPA